MHCINLELAAESLLLPPRGSLAWLFTNGLWYLETMVLDSVSVMNRTESGSEMLNLWKAGANIPG